MVAGSSPAQGAILPPLWEFPDFKTKDLEEALKRATVINVATERLWAAMAAGKDVKHEWDRHAAAVRLAQSLGFSYKTAEEITAGPTASLDERLAALVPSIGKGPSEIKETSAGLATEPAPASAMSGSFIKSTTALA